MRSMFIPAAHTVCSAARSSPGAGASPTASIGVHTAPRAKIPTALTCSASPSPATS
jgi:hypothetical protein